MKNIFSRIKIDKKETLNYLISFLISLITVLTVYFIFSVFLDFSPLRSDSLLLFVPTMKDLARSVFTKDGIYYSMNSFLGSGNAFNLSNQFFSPFNILFLIFYNADICFVFVLVVVLKICTATLSFRAFCVKVLKCNGIASIIIPVFYANCAFSLAYCTIAFMWLDAVIILPLIALGIYDLIKNEKRVLLIISYAYLFLTQFYIGYMVGIISFAAFILYLFISFDFSSEGRLKKLSSKFLNYFLCVVISCLLSAFSWIPTLFFILANRVPDSSATENLHGSFLSVINGLYLGNGYGVVGFLPYIYCGLPVLILGVLFFLNKNIKRNEKLFFGILAAFLVLCMSVKPLNIFLHVFDQPDLMHFRYSFALSFVLCSVAAREVSLFEKISVRKTVIVFSSMLLYYIAMIFVSLMLDFKEVNDVYLNSLFGFVMNLAFIALWIVSGFLLFYKEKKFARIIVAVLCIAEICVSSLYVMRNTTSNEVYDKWFDTMNRAVNEIKSGDKGFYRVITSNDYSINSDAMFGFNGISDMGDQEKYTVRNFLSNIGFSTSARFIDGGGYNPVSDMLTGVKYIVKIPEGYYYSDSPIEDVAIDENEYYLGPGFMISGNLVFYEYYGRDVFENMNDIVMFMTGNEKECFVKIPENDIAMEFGNIDVLRDENGIVFKRISEGDGIINIYSTSDKYDNVYLQIEKDKPNLSDADYRIVGSCNKGNIFYSDYASLSSANLMYKGEDGVNNLSLVSIEGASPEKLEFNKINVYGLDEAVLKEQYDILSDGAFRVTDYRNGYIKGKVKVSDGKKVLFMSIPYDAGWNAYVNGSESHIIRLIDGTFMGLMFADNGEYTVEFKYECPGLKIGIWVSLLGIIAFLSVVYEKKLKNLKIK